MDRALLERMVGAIALVLLLVIVAPALLDGTSESGFDKFANSPDDKEIRTQVIVLNEPRAAKQSSDKVPDKEAEAPKIIAPTRPAQVTRSEASVPPPVPASVAPKPAQAPTSAADPVPTRLAKMPNVAPSPPAVVAVKPQAAPEQPDSKVSQTDRTSATAGFAVQLGSFGQVANAQKFATQLSDRGFAVFVRSPTSAIHRVYAGPRPSRDAAEKLAAVLGDAGYKGIVVDLSSDSGNGGR